MSDAKVHYVEAPWGWAQIPHPEAAVLEVHLLPIADVRAHAFDRDCPCGAHEDQNCTWMVIHYAFDGRETYEQTGRKKH